MSNRITQSHTFSLFGNRKRERERAGRKVRNAKHLVSINASRIFAMSADRERERERKGERSEGGGVTRWKSRLRSAVEPERGEKKGRTQSAGGCAKGRNASAVKGPSWGQSLSRRILRSLISAMTKERDGLAFRTTYKLPFTRGVRKGARGQPGSDFSRVPPS